MNYDQAARLVQLLLAAGHGGWNDEGVELLVAEMSAWDDLDAARDAFLSLAREDRAFRPAHGQVIAEYRRQVAVRRERQMRLEAPVPIRRGCGGSGMMPGSNAPCPRCNPYQADLYADPEKWRLYTAEGVGMHVLHDGVRLNAKHEYEYDVPPPPPCLPETFHDPERTVISPQRGYDVAMAAHVQDCHLRGIEVNVDKFHRFLGPLLGKQGQEPEVKFGVAPKPRDPSGPERAEDF